MQLAFLLWLASIAPQPMADHICLATTIYLEARSEPVRGQMAVAEVALRRRDNGRWGPDLCAVVRAPGQFATATEPPDRLLKNPHAWQKAWRIAARSLEMWRRPTHERQLVVPHADSFVASAISSPVWANGQPLATIGAHDFYRVN